MSLWHLIFLVNIIYHGFFYAEIHLTSMNLRETIKEGNEKSQQDCAKTLIFLRHYLHEDLKNEHLTVKDPFTLWNNLNDRFDHQKKGDFTKSSL